MSSKCKTVYAALLAVLLWCTGCALPVSPPENWPPEDDTTPPGRPLDAAVSVTVTVDGDFRRAVRVAWLPVPDTDVELYRIIRIRDDTNEEIRYYRPGHTAHLSDIGIEFPAGTDAAIVYRYAIEAIDSSGNIGDASGPHTAALVQPPDLIAPKNGSIVSVRPQFKWNDRFDEKEYELVLVTVFGDTVLNAALGTVYGNEFVYDFDDFEDNSGIRPDPLILGGYRWLLRMTLLKATGMPEARTGLSIGTFSVQ